MGIAVLWLLLACFLMASRTSHVKPEWFHEVFLVDRNNQLDAAHAHTPTCRQGVTNFSSEAAQAAGTPGARDKCFIPPGRALQLTRFGIVVTEALATAASEDCEIVLETSDTASAANGSAVESSRIMVGAGNADTVNCTGLVDSDIFDAIGEFCMLDLDLVGQADETLVDGGGWYTVHWDDGDSANTCSASQGVELILWGYYK